MLGSPYRQAESPAAPTGAARTDWWWNGMSQRREPGGRRVVRSPASTRQLGGTVGVCEVCGRQRDDLVALVEYCMDGCCSDRSVGVCQWCLIVTNLRS